MRAGKTSKSDNLFGGGSDSEGDLFDSDEDSSAPTSTSGTGASGGLFGSSAASSSTGKPQSNSQQHADRSADPLERFHLMEPIGHGQTSLRCFFERK